jgi:hypothetical protein
MEKEMIAGILAKTFHSHPAFLFPMHRHPDVIPKKKRFFESNLQVLSYRGLKKEHISLWIFSGPGYKLWQNQGFHH